MQFMLMFYESPEDMAAQATRAAAHAAATRAMGLTGNAAVRAWLAARYPAG